jgi:ABC-type nickel/cobalt efflux system permease component RcnA
MSLLDRSPGGFVAIANTILYAVVLLETWMLTTASMVAMVMTMGVIIVVAAWLCRWMLDLLGPEDHALDYEPQPARAAKAATVPAPAPAPARVVARPVIQ